jgi:hypothetical protein
MAAGLRYTATTRTGQKTYLTLLRVFFVAGETTYPQSCFLAAVVVLPSVYTAVTSGFTVLVLSAYATI